MIKSKHILFFAFFTLLLLGCKKDKVPCTTCSITGGGANCEDIQNVKNFFYFKVGSYWVYEEETSGDLDTVYVTEASENPSNYDFDIRMYSSYQDFYYHFWPEYYGAGPCQDSGPICFACLRVKRSKYKPGEYVGEGRSFIFVMEVGDFEYVPNTAFTNNKIIIDAEYESYVLDTLLFNRTVKIHELNTFIEDKQPTNHYFSENVGLVRKELLDSNKIWNLIDYYIQP